MVTHDNSKYSISRKVIFGFLAALIILIGFIMFSAFILNPSSVGVKEILNLIGPVPLFAFVISLTLSVNKKLRFDPKIFENKELQIVR